MKNDLKSLAGDTIVYGVSTMMGKFLNWLLMPFYIRTLLPEEYGTIVHLYGLISILLVVFTYGMETGFFRYARRENFSNVYRTLLTMLGCSSILLVITMAIFSQSLSNLFYNGHFSTALFLAGVIIAIDSFLSVPFANLRLNNKALKFSIIRLTGIILNIILNVLFLVIIPKMIIHDYLPEYVVDIYLRGTGVFYVIISNLVSSCVMFLFFIKEIFQIRGSFDKSLVKKVINYCWPLLIVGITGMITQNSDKVLMPILIKEQGLKELAIYGANFKIGVLMTLFTQSFRFAFEPYFFRNSSRGIEDYAKIMNYFVFFGVIIFLGVTLFLDLINVLLTSEYLRGNVIIPFILMANLFYGIYFNLSLWYKLTDRTYFGVIFGSLGMILTVSLNFILIPLYGMIGASIAVLLGYFVMVLLSYYYGQKYYAVPYPIWKILSYIIAGVGIFFFDYFIQIEHHLTNYLYKAVIFVLFIWFFIIIQKGFHKHRK